MYNNLICIIGPDGSGKTTQANLLIRSLKEKNLNYEYKWLRFNHFLSLPMLFIARILNLSEIKTLKNGEKIGYHYFYKSKLISKIYTITLFLDTVIFNILKVYIPIVIFNQKIVSDRFVYDTIVDLIISTGQENILDKFSGKLFIKLIPEKTTSIMLISNENTLKSRRDDVKFDKTLIQKINIYKKLSKKFDIPCIEADQPINDINKQIQEILDESII